MNAASSDAKNTAALAMSEGSDNRPSGMVAMNFARIARFDDQPDLGALLLSNQVIM